MEELSGWASSILVCRGTIGGCTPAWCSQRRRRKMVRTLMSLQPPQKPERRHHLVATPASPLFPSTFPCLGFSCTFSHLSPCGRAWKQDVFGTQDSPYKGSPSTKPRVPEWELKEVGEGVQGEDVVTQGQAIMQQHRARRRCQVPGNLELITD